jgi:uncharacterized protein YdaU (DUF1376 family)
MKAPAFQFYADDFIGGTVVFSAEDVGAYMRLLCYQWGNGAIPTRKELVDRIAGCAVGPDVMAKFPDGKNARMEREREKQADYRLQQSAKGKASAQARFNRGSTAVQPSGEPEGQPKVNSPSPSPSPSPISNTVTESQPPTPSASADASHPWEGDWKRLGKLFRRRESTKPTQKERKALKAITPIPDDDLTLIEAYYNAPHPPDADYRRRDLQTLINNWPGELDRATRFKPAKSDKRGEWADSNVVPMVPMTDPAEAERIASAARQAAREFREGMGR